ncbi:MAG TPA: STAS domain-containing protein [Streptosporangiaceae bacterium]|jgi:anti-anti-sigma factor
MASSCTHYGLVELERDRRHRYGERPPRRVTRNPHVSIQPELADGTATLIIAGELDLVSVPELTWQLQQLLARLPTGVPGRLVFDLTGVPFIDVATARLMSEATRTRPDAGPPVIRRPGPGVRRVLALTGFDALCVFEEE